MFAILTGSASTGRSGVGGKASGVVDGVRSAARELRQALASFDPAAVDGTECAALADELARTEKACAAARLLAVRHAAAGGAHRENGFTDAASWLARQGGTTTTQARHDLETAAGLDACQLTKQALLSGDVSLAQAHEITKAESESPGQETDLLNAAKSTDLSGLRDHVRDRRLRQMRPDELHEQQHRARRFRHWRDGLGMVCFEGALPPETGIPLVNRIEQHAQRVRRSAIKEGHAAERFDAFAADALVCLCSSSETAQVPRGPRAEVMIVCDLFAYRRGHAHDGEVCHIVGGGPVPVQVGRDFADDAFIKAVLHDGTTVHTVKHFGRHLSAELRTALDLGPVPAFTGRQCADCGRRYGLEYDHIDPVAHHGPTSYDNIEARCWADHKAKTERDRAAGLLGPTRASAPPPRSAPRRGRAGTSSRRTAGPSGKTPRSPRRNE